MSARAAGIRRGLALRVPRAPSLGPRMRRRLALILVLMAAVGAGYAFWLRDSSLVAVEGVTVTGVSGRDAGAVRGALESAAGDMTTLHLRRDELERAVRRFPVVGGLELAPDFPHGLRIRVLPRRAAAVVVGGGSRSVVAGDGTILPAGDAPDGLPTIRAAERASGRRLSDPVALAAARVAGGAPATLAGRLTAVRRTGDRGLVVEMEDGPDLIFGEVARVRAKWIAATRVLADGRSEGATYIDLRIPERPAAGGLAPDPVDPAPEPAQPVPGPQPGVPAPAAPVPDPGATDAATPQPAPAEPAPAQPQVPPAAQQGGGAAPIPNPQP